MKKIYPTKAETLLLFSATLMKFLRYKLRYKCMYPVSKRLSPTIRNCLIAKWACPAG